MIFVFISITLVLIVAQKLIFKGSKSMSLCDPTHILFKELCKYINFSFNYI